MIKIFECEQGSETWNQLRCGVPTASDFNKIVNSKGQPSTQREKYLYQLAVERITKKVEPTYQNGNMSTGKLRELDARNYYEFCKKVKVKQVGFCLRDKPKCGCSPDSLVSINGGLEIKCPLGTTHVQYLLDNRLAVEYIPQVQGSLFVTGRDWWDFMSHYPDMRPLIIRVKPDKAFQAKLKRELELFCADLDRLVRRIK
jgi:hypothetical protein